MALDAEKEAALRDQLFTQAKEISEADPTVLIPPGIGLVGQAAQITIFQNIKLLSSALLAVDRATSPVPDIEKIVVDADKILVGYRALHALRDSLEADKFNRVNRVVDRINQAWLNCFTPLLQAVMFHLMRSWEPKRLEATVIEASNAAATLVRQSEDAEKMLNEIGDVLKRAGLATQSGYFGAAASADRKASMVWLGVAIMASIAIFAYGYFGLPAKAAAAQAPNYASLLERWPLHIVNLTLLFTSLVFAIRNYSSLRHNVTVNRHCAISLATYRAIIRPLKDERVREVVIEKAANTIFGHQPSGYLKGETQSSPVTPVIGAVQAVIPKSEK
jgi:hypothetical protein